jgi:hypothetical protein
LNLAIAAHFYWRDFGMMKRVGSYKSLIAVAALAAGIAASVTSASATVVLSDNFNASSPTLNWAGDSVFTPVIGAVDLVGGSVFGNLDVPPESGNAVDLNGSAGAQGGLGSVATVAAGTYTLTFLLAGPSPDGTGDTRSGSTATTTVSIGNWSTVLSPSTDAGYGAQTFTFTTTGGQLLFAESNSSNAIIGDLIDNVVLSTAAVPEPSTWALMLLGFVGLGFAGYRSSKTRLTLHA